MFIPLILLTLDSLFHTLLSQWLVRLLTIHTCIIGLRAPSLSNAPFIISLSILALQDVWRLGVLGASLPATFVLIGFGRLLARFFSLGEKTTIFLVVCGVIAADLLLTGPAVFGTHIVPTYALFSSLINAGIAYVYTLCVSTPGNRGARI